MGKRAKDKPTSQLWALIALTNLFWLCCMGAQAQTSSVVSYSGPPVSIPESQPSGVDIYLEVSGLGVLTDLEFRLDSLPGCDASVGNPNASITHTFVGDLILRLTAPDGAPTVAVIDRAGEDANNFCTVLLDDDGGYPSISSYTGPGPVQGNFAPQNPLSAFAGENPNGYWKLNISDNFPGDVGTLNRFSLVLHTLPITEIDVDVLDDPFPNGCTPGSCSLREAINLANAQPGLDRIVLPASTQLQLTRAGADEDANFTGDLDILEEVEIVGAGPAQTILTQTANDRLFDVRATAINLTLRQLRIQGGRGVQVGGAIVSFDSSLRIEDAELIGNQATSRGGAVYFRGQTSPLVRSEFNRVVFDDNQASSWGGALYAYSSGNVLETIPNVLINGCTFSNNSAGTGGGAAALSAYESSLNIQANVRDSLFEHNRVTGQGGGGALGINVLDHGDISVDIDNSIFLDNRVEDLAGYNVGGAISSSNNSGRIKIKRSLFEANFAGSGGAVYLFNGEIDDSTFCTNSVINAGGAIFSRSDQFLGSTSIRRSTFCNNTVSTLDASMTGGGAIAAPGGFLTVERSTLVGNTAFRGGAISVGSGDLILTSNTMEAPAQAGGALGSLLRHGGTSNTDVLRFSSNILVGQCSFQTSGIVPDGAFYNIEAGGNTCRLGQATIAAGNQLSATTASINLGSLADNGGPTDTRLPIAPSIAINHGYTLACTPLDQRGYTRNDSQCDAGSVEVGGFLDSIFSDDFD